MLQVYCTGPPFEIGYTHGRAASAQIQSGLQFYQSLFEKQCRLNWNQVCDTALKFLPFLESRHPDLVEEMKGVASGAGVPFPSILALNVRTEIAYGMFQSDGCTALSWKTGDASFLAQNWDWQHEQKENLVSLRIQRRSDDESDAAPSIHMITEAGIIGKIGMNAKGVGTCLNAIRARGVRFDALPCHLALRRCLEARSRDEAVKVLEGEAVASACHILVADAVGGGMGLECSAHDVMKVVSDKGIVTHTNHYILPHNKNVVEQGAWKDSPVRLARVQELLADRIMKSEGPSEGAITEILRDEQNFPTSINRHETEDSTVATLFTIVMDLKRGFANVTLGRPTDIEDSVQLTPAAE
ncbi:MAG: hypothetical protein M1820_008578 [Bogoriella megaspora]|nr:MAG: hypothetical protein M1820_008578 [Bogoriella megaspora]